MAKKKTMGNVSGIALGIFFICMVAVGMAAVVLKGGEAASGKVSARIGMLDAGYRDLRAQVIAQAYGPVVPPPAPSSLKPIIRMGLNEAVTNPIVFTANAVKQTMASFAITNESDDAVMLKRINLMVQPHQPMSGVKAYLVQGTEQKQIGSPITVPDQASGKEISFSKSSGLFLQPHGTAIINIVARPLFSAALGLGKEGIVLKSVEIFGTLPFALYGQDLSTSGGGVTPTSTSSGVLSVRANPSFPSTANPGTPGMTIGSFILSSSSAEPIKLTTLIFDKDESAGLKLGNLRVRVNGVQIGTTQAVIGDAESSIAFSGATPVVIPANGSVTVYLNADIADSSAVGTYPSIFDLVGGSTIGGVSNVSIPFPASASNQVDGQGLTLVRQSASTLSLSTSPDNVSPQYLTMGSTDQVVYKIKLRASGAEDVRVGEISFRDSIENNTAGMGSFYNFRLYDESNSSFAGPVNMALSGTGTGTIGFTETADFKIVVPKNGSRTLTLKADVAQYVSGAAKSGSRHTFGIASTSAVRVFGKDSSAPTVVSGTPSGTPQTVYRTKPGLTTSRIGAATGRFRLAVDDVATLNWQNAGASGDLKISTVKIKFAGLALTSGTPSFTANLIDLDGPNVNWGGSGQGTCIPASGSCSVTFSPNSTIVAGTAKQVKLRIDSSNFGNVGATGDSLAVTIDAASGITWSDGTSNGIVWNVTEPGSSIPITIATVSYE